MLPTMLEFANTERRTEDIHGQYHAEFEIAARMFSVWMNRTWSRSLSRSELPVQTLYLSMLLNVQVCRQYRTIVELCKTCEAHNASIVARSLFETVLAAYFLLAPQFRIVVEPER